METAGFYCSTSGTVFASKDALTDHYKSDLHRYNLKRKVAGLPPVTREWFEARKEQLASLQARAATPCVYICPLTKKKFKTEATYQTHTGTKAFKAALKAAGLTEAPPPEKRTLAPRPPAAAGAAPAAGGPTQTAFKAERASSVAAADAADDDSGDSESGWATDDDMDEEVAEKQQAEDAETAADAPGRRAAVQNAVDSSADNAADAPADGADWEAWDVRRSLFDNHVSGSFQENLDYMFRHFGFYFPDAPYLTDPEGLLRYLGAKIEYGHVPLFASGLDPSAKRFRSVHAVQRHMIDANKCRMLYDGNEDEYEEFYEYPDDDEANAIVLFTEEDAGLAAGQELVLAEPGSNHVRVLGTRGFRQLYRQRHKPADTRQSVVVNQMLQAYRNFGIQELGKEEMAKRVQRLKHERRRQHHDMKVGLKNDKIFNLPKNVTY